LLRNKWWAALPPGCFGMSEPSLISWQHNLITDEDNNQIIFDSQKNYQNQISSIIVYHKNKPISKFDYFL